VTGTVLSLCLRQNVRVTGIYDEPELYELACAYRDVGSEVDALERWYTRHAAPAGPADHALEFARRGAQVTTLDLSAAMCARARDKAAAAGVKLDVVRGDMRDFTVPRPVDLAITMLNSACHLMTLDDLVAHVAAVSGAVVPGGLYILELAHPADLLTPVPRTSSEWDSEVGDRRVHVRWGGGEDVIDPVTQVTREHVQVTVRDGAGIRTLADVAVRLAGGFGAAARYGDFTDDVDLSDRQAWRMIFVLRRD
jgi:SAM-dependent methyltransferase